MNQDKVSAIKKTMEGANEDHIVEAIEDNTVLVSTILKGADHDQILETIEGDEELLAYVKQNLVGEVEEEDED